MPKNLLIGRIIGFYPASEGQILYMVDTEEFDNIPVPVEASSKTNICLEIDDLVTVDLVADRGVILSFSR